MIVTKKVNGPTLAAGKVDLVFGEIEKVSGAAVFFEDPAADNTVFDAKTTISGQTVGVTITKCNATAASPTAWGAAVTGDVAGLDVVVVAKGI